MKIIILIVAAFILSSCGTQKSLTEVEYIQYGIVDVSENLTVVGKLVAENDSIVEISVDGAIVSFNKTNIFNYSTELRPNPDAMLRDIVENTNTTANNTGFFVGLTVVSTAIVVILTLVGI